MNNPKFVKHSLFGSRRVYYYTCNECFNKCKYIAEECKENELPICPLQKDIKECTSLA